MGGAQSAQSETERVTLERESFNVVNVSEDVVNRLTGAGGSSGPPGSSSAHFEAAQLTEAASDDLSNQMQERLRSALVEEQQLTRRLRQDLSSSYQELRALRDTLARLEADMRKSEGSGFPWSGVKQSEYHRKMEELAGRQKELQEAMKRQFKETVDSVTQRFFSAPAHSVCPELEAKVLQCYMDNPKKTLLCSEIAKEFISCVGEYRAEMLKRQA